MKFNRLGVKIVKKTDFFAFDGVVNGVVDLYLLLFQDKCKRRNYVINQFLVFV